MGVQLPIYKHFLSRRRKLQACRSRRIGATSYGTFFWIIGPRQPLMRWQSWNGLNGKNNFKTDLMQRRAEDFTMSPKEALALKAKPCHL
jgi:hypothetical protein